MPTGPKEQINWQQYENDRNYQEMYPEEYKKHIDSKFNFNRDHTQLSDAEFTEAINNNAYSIDDTVAQRCIDLGLFKDKATYDTHMAKVKKKHTDDGWGAGINKVIGDNIEWAVPLGMSLIIGMGAAGMGVAGGGAAAMNTGAISAGAMEAGAAGSTAGVGGSLAGSGLAGQGVGTGGMYSSAEAAAGAAYTAPVAGTVADLGATEAIASGALSPNPALAEAAVAPSLLGTAPNLLATEQIASGALNPDPAISNAALAPGGAMATIPGTTTNLAAQEAIASGALSPIPAVSEAALAPTVASTTPAAVVTPGATVPTAAIPTPTPTPTLTPTPTPNPSGAGGLQGWEALLAGTSAGWEAVLAGTSALADLLGTWIGIEAGKDATDDYLDAVKYATDQQREMFEKSLELTEPWRQAGVAALGQLQEKIDAGPGEFEESPGYNFRLAEGEKAIDRMAAAKGQYLSGGRLKALEQYSQNYASNEYDKFIDRYYQSMTPLQSLAGLGQTSAENAGQNAITTGQTTGNLALAGGTANANQTMQGASQYQNLLGNMAQLPKFWS